MRMTRSNILKKNLKIKEQEEIMNVDEDDENFNGKINLQNDERDDNIDLDGVYWAR